MKCGGGLTVKQPRGVRTSKDTPSHTRHDALAKRRGVVGASAVGGSATAGPKSCSTLAHCSSFHSPTDRASANMTLRPPERWYDMACTWR